MQTTRTDATAQITLIDQFVQVVEATTATVERIPYSADALTEALARKTIDLGLTVFSEPESLDLALFQPSLDRGVIKRNPSEAEMAIAHVGITDAFAGVARTGSVCLPITRHTHTAVSLLPEEHIVVLDGAKIVARPRDIFTAAVNASEGMFRNFIFISGPSSTADMGSVVRGAHGPKRLHIILLISENQA